MENKKQIGIAALIDENTVMINVGFEDDIDEGEVLRVLSKDKITVYDPFTKEKLADIRKTKAELYVSEVFANYSYCRSKPYHEPDILNNYIVHEEKLRLKGEKIGELYTLEPIEVGDPIEFLE